MTVSIIVPAYNAKPFLLRALTSARAAGSRVQGGFEIIAVDNGSTDGTRSVIEQFAAQHPTSVIATYCPKRGAPAARNHGVGLSSGRWLQFLDADDTLSVEKIAQQIELAGSLQWVVGAYQHLFADGTTEDVVPNKDLWRGLFFNYRTGNTHSNLLRRDALDRIGGWDESLSSNQDPELHFRLLKAAVPYVIDEQVNSYYHHHSGGGRITAGSATKRIHNQLNMLIDANEYLIAHRHDYWRAHAGYFDGAVLRSIRMLATHDLAAAGLVYNNYFRAPASWATPQPYELLPSYTKLYPYLGFHNLEWLRIQLAKVLPASLKRTLKA